MNFTDEPEILRVNEDLTLLYAAVNGDVIFDWVEAPRDLHTYNTFAFGYRAGSDGRFMELDNIRLEIIPEPGSATLALISLVFLAGVRRRSRRT